MSAPVPGGPSAAKGRKCAPGRLLARICTFVRPTTTGEKNNAGTGAQSFAAYPLPATDVMDEKAAARAANTQPGREGGCGLLQSLMRVHKRQVRKLGSCFGIEYPSSIWSEPADVDHDAGEAVVRVHKPIRVRVRRNCHKCQTMFGPGSRECAACKHKLCKACGRKPARHGDPEVQKLAAARDARDRQVAAAAVALFMRNGDLSRNAGSEGASRNSCSRHSEGSTSSTTPLMAASGQTEGSTGTRTMPFVPAGPSRTVGADLVFRRPRQRVRHSCCQCSEVFPRGRHACGGQGCGHMRCPDCPRQPATRLWYAGTVADDDDGMAPAPLQYRCHLCRTKYPLNAPEAAICVTCGHARCDTCTHITMPPSHPAPAHAPPAVPATPAATTSALDAQSAHQPQNH